MTSTTFRRSKPGTCCRPTAAQPVTFVRGEGVRLYDADGREYLDLLSGIGVAVARTRASRTGARDRGSGADAAPHVEPVLSPAAGSARRAARAPVRAAARVLLQQRRRSGRGLSEVRAALLVHARRAAHRDHRARGVVSRPHVRRAVGHLRRALSRAVRAAARRACASCRPTIRRRCCAAVSTSTAAIIAEPIQGEGGVRPLTPAFAAAITRGVRPHRRAADRRRSAERPRPHRLSVLLRGASA